MTNCSQCNGALELIDWRDEPRKGVCRACKTVYILHTPPEPTKVDRRTRRLMRSARRRRERPVVVFEVFDKTKGTKEMRLGSMDGELLHISGLQPSDYTQWTASVIATDPPARTPEEWARIIDEAAGRIMASPGKKS